MIKSILLIEDDEVDVIGFKRVLSKLNTEIPLIRAKDGIEAVEILRGEVSTALQKPYLIVLDLNMPRMNGIEFLAILENDYKLKDSIVYILTTSDYDKDKEVVSNFNVNGYINKKDFYSKVITNNNDINSLIKLISKH
ncbi:MAG: response regulator [bacterium]|nr:response regulator [bacterium]